MTINDAEKIIHLKTLINNKKVLINLLKEIPRDLTITKDDFIIAIETYKSKTISKINLFYLFIFIDEAIDPALIKETSGLETYNAFKNFDAIIQNIYNYSRNIYEKEIDNIYNLFSNIGKPFSEKIFTNDALLSYAYLYVDRIDKELTEEEINIFHIVIDELEKRKNPEGIFILGRILYGDSTDHGYVQDYKKALKCYIYSGKNGISQGYTNAGYIYYYNRLNKSKNQYKQAYYYFLKAYFMDGNINALYKLSDMFKQGLYAKKDQETAMLLIQKAYKIATDHYLIFNTQDLPFSEIVVRYFNLAQELNYPLQKEDEINLFRAYYFEKMINEKYDYYGSEEVLKNNIDTINKYFSLKDFSSFNDLVNRLHYTNGEELIFYYHNCNLVFTASFIKDEWVKGELPFDLIHNFIFKVTRVIQDNNSKFPLEYENNQFIVNYLNINLVSIFNFSNVFYTKKEEGYISVQDENGIQQLMEMVSDYYFGKVKFGRIISKYHEDNNIGSKYDYVEITLKSKQNKENTYIIRLLNVFESDISTPFSDNRTVLIVHTGNVIITDGCIYNTKYYHFVSDGINYKILPPKTNKSERDIA